MPRVTVSPPSSASALPIATTSSPTCTWSESPSSIALRFAPSTLMTARSLDGSRPSTFAVSFRPSENCAWIRDASSMTWLLVTITPSDEITKPVPAAPPLSGPPSSTIATTAGTSARRIAAMSPSVVMVSAPRTMTSRPATPSLAALSLSSATNTPDATSAPTRPPARPASRNWRRLRGRLGAGAAQERLAAARGGGSGRPGRGRRSRVLRGSRGASPGWWCPCATWDPAGASSRRTLPRGRGRPSWPRVPPG